MPFEHRGGSRLTTNGILGSDEGCFTSTEGIQDQYKAESRTPKEDTSRFIWKSEEELYWELMGSCGERMLANVSEISGQRSLVPGLP